MSGQGTAGNVIAALASFCFPGLGQLVQGRPLAALFMCVMTFLLWCVLLGWVVHLWSILDAALWRGGACPAPAREPIPVLPREAEVLRVR